MLRKSNVKVDTAKDGLEAFDMVRKMYEDGYAYMMVFMDVHMPIYDGYKGTRKIRMYEEEKRYPKSNILCVSADEGDLMVSKSKEAKMDAFIAKPISKPRLDELIYMRATGIKEFDETKLKFK